MFSIAIAGAILGGLGALAQGLMAVRAQRKADEADSAQLRDDANEAALEAMQQRQDLAAADERRAFDIQSAEIEGERAAAAQAAATGASGLMGISKTAVTDQLRADYDRAIGQLERDRAAAYDAGLNEIRKTTHAVGVATAAADAIDADLGSTERIGRDILSVTFNTLTGAWGGYTGAGGTGQGLQDAINPPGDIDPKKLGKAAS